MRNLLDRHMIEGKAADGVLRLNLNFRESFGMQRKRIKVVGIDLAGSEKRNTGFCQMEGDRAEVSVLHTDEEILQALGQGVRAAAIDAPLSLPREGGRLRRDCPCVGKAHFRDSTWNCGP